MTGNQPVTYALDFSAGRKGRQEIKTLSPGRRPNDAKAVGGSIPRIARLMALAIRCDALVRSGEVKDHAELARRANLTRARVSQILNLVHLAPDDPGPFSDEPYAGGV